LSGCSSSIAHACPQTARILLANLLQSSRSTFSWGNFLSFFAFKEGRLGTQILALWGFANSIRPLFERCEMLACSLVRSVQKTVPQISVELVADREVCGRYADGIPARPRRLSHSMRSPAVQGKRGSMMVHTRTPRGMAQVPASTIQGLCRRAGLGCAWGARGDAC
jgi:hypothetical protein